MNDLDAAEQRIAVLENEVAALKILLGSRTVAPPRLVEPSVRVATPALRRLALPTDAEFDRLSEVVLGRYPQLRPRADQQGFDAQFRVSFVRLQHIGRRDRLESERALTWWTDDCRAWQRQHQNALNVFVGGAAFVTAVIACGDILFSSPDSFPHVSLALQFGGGGRLSDDSWREVLASGRLREPTPLDRPTAVRSPAIVRGY
jgi:hypothetical protein